MAGAFSTPITESCGPVMPTSVMAAVPPGSTRSSAVATCVCVPTTSDARPSRCQARAIFSDVTSAWKSTTTTGVCSRRRAVSASSFVKGSSTQRHVDAAHRVHDRHLRVRPGR